MARTILCLLALVCAALAYPADVVPQVPPKTQVVAQLEVHPAEEPLKTPIQQPLPVNVAEIPIQEPLPVANVPIQEPLPVKIAEEPVQIPAEVLQQRVEEIKEAQQEEALEESYGAPDDIPAGANPDSNPEEDKSDLEGANTFWGGWGRRWGGGWGGYGYYPRRHYGYGHGYGRGYGHYGHYGYGRGYGGWGGYW